MITIERVGVGHKVQVLEVCDAGLAGKMIVFLPANPKDWYDWMLSGRQTAAEFLLVDGGSGLKFYAFSRRKKIVTRQGVLAAPFELLIASDVEKQSNKPPMRDGQDFVTALTMRREGKRYKDIAALFGFSIERARQMVARAERAERLLLKDPDGSSGYYSESIARICHALRDQKAQP